ncbi:MAG TPA: helix-turn-helix domain-containing protein [bacterium]|nr:helix-turn-helix domain-containing protein [bacterium]
MQHKKFVSTSEAGEILGLSRTQVFRLVQSGKIPAIRVGGNYLIKLSDLGVNLETNISKAEKEVDKAVKRVFKEYGDVIKKLGEE